MKYFVLFYICVGCFNTSLKNDDSVNRKFCDIIDTTLTIDIDTVTVCDSKLPNLDTLAAYILTQSKNDSVDINCMIQVMLNRFQMSGFDYISTMLYSNTSYGSGTVKRGGGRYWFTGVSKKYKPLVEREINNVINDVVYIDMMDTKYFSNHSCTYHSNNPKYKFVLATKKHQYYVKN